MAENEIKSGKLLKMEQTDEEVVKSIEKILGTKRFIVLVKREGSRCQNPTCLKDHTQCYLSEASGEDLVDAFVTIGSVLENYKERQLSKKAIVSPFVGKNN